MKYSSKTHEQTVRFSVREATLEGNLCVPHGASGIVLFAHGSGSSRHSPRNRFVAETLQGAGVGTLLFDLLTAEEEAVDLRTAHLRFDIPFLASRLLGATDWVTENAGTCDLRIGYFGSSTGGAAALVAAAHRAEKIGAVVCRGSRTDLAEQVLPRVKAPTLFIVGEDDQVVLELNRVSFALLGAEEKKFEVIPGATHLFEEPGTLEEVARLAANWFAKHLSAPGRE